MPIPGELVTDPVTGRRALYVDASGKPGLPRSRRSAVDLDPCPFCSMAGQAGSGRARVDDSGTTRPLLAVNRSGFVIANRWSVFQPPGTCDLIIAGRHVEGLEQLPATELADLVDLLTAQLQLRASTGQPTIGFVNVGADAGGSIKHLHGQVVTSPYPDTVGPLDPAAVTADWRQSRERHLTVDPAQGADGNVKADSSSIWVAAAPTSVGEVRIRSLTSEALSTALGQVTRHLTERPYNVVISTLNDRSLFAQVLPRDDRGIIYPQYFGITIVNLDLRSWAATLSTAPATATL